MRQRSADTEKPMCGAMPGRIASGCEEWPE